MPETIMIHPAAAPMLGRGVWMIDDVALRGLLAAASRLTFEEIAAAKATYAAASDPMPRMVGDVAVIDAVGPIVYRRSWLSHYLSLTAIEGLQAQLRAALADDAVRAIVFRWHSPGGSVEMVPEFADELFAARGQKSIVSVADTMIGSAAYWLATQTDTIYTPVSGDIGSVGCFLVHGEYSRALDAEGVTVTVIRHGANKAEGNPYEPLSDEARAEYQRIVDEIGGEFESAVARGRGIPKRTVTETFGQGRSYRGRQAIALGMADKLSSVQQVLARLTRGRGGQARARAAAEADTEGVPAPCAEAAEAAEAAVRAACDCAPECPCHDGDEPCPPDCESCEAGCGCREQQAAAAQPAPEPETSEGVEQTSPDEEAILAVLSAES